MCAGLVACWLLQFKTARSAVRARGALIGVLVRGARSGVAAEALGIEARRGETRIAGLDAKHESPGPAKPGNAQGVAVKVWPGVRQRKLFELITNEML